MSQCDHKLTEVVRNTGITVTTCLICNKAVDGHHLIMADQFERFIDHDHDSIKEAYYTVDDDTKFGEQIIIDETV